MKDGASSGNAWLRQLHPVQKVEGAVPELPVEAAQVRVYMYIYIYIYIYIY